MIKNTNETITRNIPTPAFVFVIWVTEASNDEAFPIKSDTSSVKPLLKIFADWEEISENSPLETLKAKVNNPIIKDTTPNTRTAPAIVKTKSLAVNANISYLQYNLLCRYVAINMPNYLSYFFLVISNGRSETVIFSPSQKSMAR